MYLELREDGVLPGNYHGLTPKEIIDFIENPLAIIEMKNGRLNLLSVTNESKNNGLVSIELESEKFVNEKNDKYNFVVTAFKTYDRYAEKALTDNGIKVWHKKEDLSINHPQLHKWMGTIERKSSNDSIPNSSENVNTNSSTRENSIDINEQGEVSYTPQRYIAPDGTERIPPKIYARDLLSDEGSTYNREQLGKQLKQIYEAADKGHHVEAAIMAEKAAEKSVNLIISIIIKRR